MLIERMKSSHWVDSTTAMQPMITTTKLMALNTNSNVHTPVLHPSICHLALSLPYLRDLYFALSSVASVAVLECKDADKVSIS